MSAQTTPAGEKQTVTRARPATARGTGTTHARPTQLTSLNIAKVCSRHSSWRARPKVLNHRLGLGAQALTLGERGLKRLSTLQLAEGLARQYAVVAPIEVFEP